MDAGAPTADISTVSFGDVVVDVDSFAISRAGEPVPVEPQVFDVLCYLIDHRDRVVSKIELFDNIWGDRFVSESALTSRIKSARRAVGDDGRRQEVIRTTHGRGYRFVAEIIEAGNDESESAGSADPPDADSDAAASAESAVDGAGEITLLGAQQGSVPAHARPFVARDHELASLVEALTANRLVTVVGPGGVGKTRLATELATRWEHDSDDFVTFVSLASISDTDQVFVAIRDALGITTGDASGAFRTVLEAVGGTSALLVLDNFEQVVHAAKSLSDLVEASPGIRLLVTSRERLGLVGEQVLALAPLALEADESTGDAAPAMAFFEHSLRGVGSAVQLNDENRDDVAAICQTLDGLPLAMELAAAQTRYFSLSYLRTHLESQAITVADHARDRPERHHTMQSTIDWSYRLLTPSQQRLLSALSVYKTDWPFAAVDAMSDADEAGVAPRDLLALIDKSLVQRSDGVLGEPRFSMLRLVAEFAGSELDATDQRGEARQRHAAFVSETVRAIEAQRWSSNGSDWIDALNAEYVDAVEALTWSFDGGDAETGCQIVKAFGYWWYRSGRHGEGRVWIDRALAHTSAIDASTAAWIHSASGKLAMYELRREECREQLDKALSLAQEIGDDRLETLCLCDIAEAAAGAPDEYEAGLESVEAGLELARRLGNPQLIAHGLTVMGELTRANGEPEKAEAAYTEALEFNARAGDRYRKAIIALNMGHALMAQDRVDEALSSYQRGIELSSQIGSRIQMAWNLSDLAFGHHRLGESELAARLGGTAQAALERLGTTLGPADQPVHDENQRTLKNALGGNEYERLVAEGRGLSLLEGIEIALDSIDRHTN